MQYHQLRILCALRDKIAENDTSLTGHQAMDRARARITRLGSGSRELFDLEGEMADLELKYAHLAENTRSLWASKIAAASCRAASLLNGRWRVPS